MPELQVDILTAQARLATNRLRKDLKDLGLETKLSEKETKRLEQRLKKKMGADKAAVAMNRLAKSTGISRREVDLLKRKLGATTPAFKKFRLGVKLAMTGLMGIKT